MKYLIASDLHGSAYYAQKLWEAYDAEQADRLIFLGDMLYHGPRNDLPREYDPWKVTAMMNARRREILCVRGNCEAEVDQMVLEFPVMADYALLTQPRSEGGEVMVFVTHGHLFNEDQLPMLQHGDILLHGHTHVQVCAPREEYIYMNPGSLALPKDGSRHGYMTMENGTFLWKDVESGEEFLRYQL
ncbi:MAG: phosphodiesterase [Lachnospiraceae bacterium]|nr:phosphodiesterase [Lachnospiraceae bacterium]